MALVDALDGMSTCVSNGPEWLMLQLTFDERLKMPQVFKQLPRMASSREHCSHKETAGAALMDTDWSLTGVV